MSVASESSPVRRRGRPYRFPEDSTPLTRIHGGVDQRVSWLLSASRIHGSDPELAHRAHFVEVLKAQGVAADAARVSRWESGAQRVPDRVVQAYERALGLAPSYLNAAAHGLRRSLEPDSVDLETVTGPADQLHEDLDPLFERVDEGDGRGADWIALTDYLAMHPQVYLRPRSWVQLTESLIGQMGRAVGAAYVCRFEALRTLVRHAGAQRHVVKAIGAFVTDPAAQVVMHPLTLLQEVRHPRAAELTVRMLTAGTGMLQQGAAWTTAAKLARGHFADDDLTRLEGMLVMLLGAQSRSLSDADLLDIVARLPETATRRLRHAVRDTGLIHRIETMRRTGEVLPEAVTRPVALQVAREAQDETPTPYAIDPDLMLQRLVREALFHGHQERRHQASVLLNVSPYRPALADALARVVDGGEREPAHRAAMLLRYLATERQRPDLLRWATATGRRRVRSAAIISLGRLPEGLRPEDEKAVLEVLADGGRSTQHACLYALGMSGAPSLGTLCASANQMHAQAAQWWTRTGPALHEETHRTNPADSRTEGTDRG